MEPSDKDRCTAQFPGATSRQSWLPGGDGNPERERERETHRYSRKSSIAGAANRSERTNDTAASRRVASRRAAPRCAV